MRFNPLNYPLSFTEPLRLGLMSGWVQHIPFAFALTGMVRPRRFVELGTHFGESYCAFCQAVAAIKLDAEGTRCFSVDTFAGDAHSSSYSPEVLANLRAHHDPLYAKFSTIIQSKFDDALDQFEEGSIDLLHIDGFHTYEAVSHDFQTWRSKVSDRGVVIFHDTAMKNWKDFGVWKFWEEWQGKYPSFNFEHHCGLGILAVGPKAPQPLLDFLKTANEEPQAVREFYHFQGLHIERLRGVASLAMQVFQVQNLVNQWKQQTGRAIAPGSKDLNAALGDPVKFIKDTATDIHAMIVSDLNFREQLRKFLASPGDLKQAA